MVMDKSFDPQEIESKWYACREQAGDSKPTGVGEPYSILPPPNVTRARCTWVTRFSKQQKGSGSEVSHELRRQINDLARI